MLFTKTYTELHSRAKNRPPARSGLKFCHLAVLALTASLLLSACAPARGPKTGTDGAEQIASYYLPDLPELLPNSEAWLKEPPFAEKELADFVRDLHTIQTMNALDTANYLLRDRGWNRERLRYMDVKVARLIMALDSGSLEDLSMAGPYYLPPDRGEIFAVQKYYHILNNLLKARRRGF